MCGQRSFKLRRCNWGISTNSGRERCSSGCKSDGTRNDGKWGTRASNVCRLPVFSWGPAGFQDYFAAVVGLSLGWGQVRDTEKVGWQAAMAQ